MKKSPANRCGYELRSRNTFSSIDENSAPKKMNKKIKLKHEDPADFDNQSLIEVTTIIAAITTDSHRVVALPQEVLRIILLYLEPKDLFQCRTVNSLWRSSVRSILLCRNHGLKFDELKSSRQTFLSNLNRFNECLKSAKRLDSLDQFPFNRVEFFNTNLDENVVQRFLILYGPFIKSLNLSNCRSQTKKNGQVQTLYQLLTGHAPNIEELFITYFAIVVPTRQHQQIILFPNSRNGKNKKLPQLKKLKANFCPVGVYCNIGIVTELLDAADNLEWYDIDQFVHQGILDKLTSLNKIHTIKKAKINFSLLVELLDKFSNLGVKLKSVGLEVGELSKNQNDLKLLERGARIIQKILESSSNTLEVIDELPPLGFLPGFQMPILSQLKEVNISDEWNRIKESIFPLGLNLSTIFPNVQKVGVSLGSYSDYDSHPGYWHTFFRHINPTNNTWPSVKSLNISFMPLISVDDFARLFPNLKHLHLRNVYNFPMTSRGIFASMKQLEFLQFGFTICVHCSNKFPALDSAFSGFSHETCTRLASSNDTLDDGEVERLRENLSILELKNLKLLKLKIYVCCTSRILSRVSAIYAFQLMPQLRVFVTLCGGIEDRNVVSALKKIAPLVHSVTDRSD